MSPTSSMSVIHRMGVALVVAGLLLFGSRTTGAQPSSLSVSGNPALMRINSAVAGSQPTSVSNAATTYRIKVSNSSNMKVTANLNAAMPPNVTLTVTLAPPAGATSLGPVTLSTTAQDAVVGISGVNNVSFSITYQLSATVAAGVIPSSTRTVTLTLLDYP